MATIPASNIIPAGQSTPQPGQQPQGPVTGLPPYRTEGVDLDPFTGTGITPTGGSSDKTNTYDPNNPESLQPGWFAAQGFDARLQEIEAFVDKYDKASLNFKNGKYMGELWPSIKIHGETIFKSTIETFNASRKIPAKGIIPTELSMTVDGISDISIGESFVIQKGILPSKYDKFGFIVVGVDQGIKNNRWYTSIRAQTFNLADIDDAEQTVASERITKFGYY